MQSAGVLKKSTSKALGIVKLLRMKHYIKNGLIFIPLFFSLNFLQLKSVSRVFLAFISFSLMSSFIYIRNDIMDLEKDRQHPVKCRRPIASGVISIFEANITSMAVLSVSVLIGAMLGYKVLVVAFAYMTINLLYSYKLKSVPVMDVAVIALGFMLRVFIGAAVIDVTVSRWLLLTIMALSFYLGFGKRRNEIIKVDTSKDTRAVLKYYNMNFLDKAMNSMMTLAICFYSLWTIDSTVISTFKTDRLIYTVPIIVVGLFRYSLVVEGDSYGDPTDVILTDKPLQSIILSYVGVIFLLIYL